MRAHLRWLTATRFSGKQIRLADALRVDGPWLSRYMSGKGARGHQFDRSQLNTHFSQIHRALLHAELPTETPTADERAAPATTAATAAATAATTPAPKPAKPSAANPVFAPAAAPVSAVLSVDLANVDGRQSGGQCHIMALGVPVLGGGRWVMACPGGSEGADVLHLRVGLRGRRTLSARCHTSIAGRTFEWCIDVLECRHDITVHGGPLWVAREVSTNLSSLSQRIIGRAALERGGYCGRRVHGPSRPSLKAWARGARGQDMIVAAMSSHQPSRLPLASTAVVTRCILSSGRGAGAPLRPPALHDELVAADGPLRAETSASAPSDH